MTETAIEYGIDISKFEKMKQDSLSRLRSFMDSLEKQKLTTANAPEVYRSYKISSERFMSNVENMHGRVLSLTQEIKQKMGPIDRVAQQKPVVRQFIEPAKKYELVVTALEDIVDMLLNHHTESMKILDFSMRTLEESRGLELSSQVVETNVKIAEKLETAIQKLVDSSDKKMTDVLAVFKEVVDQKDKYREWQIDKLTSIVTERMLLQADLEAKIKRFKPLESSRYEAHKDPPEFLKKDEQKQQKPEEKPKDATPPMPSAEKPKDPVSVQKDSSSVDSDEEDGDFNFNDLDDEDDDP